jgi:hypothetical protein
MNGFPKDKTRNIRHKLVKFYGLSENLPLGMMLERIKRFVGEPICQGDINGFYVENGSKTGLKDISIDFDSEKIFQQIHHRGHYDSVTELRYFETYSGPIFVSIPEKDASYKYRKVLPVTKLDKSEEKFNLKIHHTFPYSVEKLIGLIEHFLDTRQHDTISTNEVSALQVCYNISFVTLENRDIAEDFVNFLNIRKLHRPKIIHTQAVILSSSEINDEIDQFLEKTQTPKKTAIQKYYDKKTFRENDRPQEKSSETIVEYKQSRKEAGNAKFSKGDEKNKVTVEQEKDELEEHESKDREKFCDERPKDVYKDKGHKTFGSAIKKKVPRRYTFTMRNKAMRKMFTLMGSGNYQVSLEETDD